MPAWLPDWNRWLNELGYEVFDVEYRMPPPGIKAKEVTQDEMLPESEMPTVYNY